MMHTRVQRLALRALNTASLRKRSVRLICRLRTIKEVSNIRFCLILPGTVGYNTEIEISVKAGVTKQRKRRNSKRIGDRFCDELLFRRVSKKIIHGIVREDDLVLRKIRGERVRKRCQSQQITLPREDIVSFPIHQNEIQLFSADRAAEFYL